MTSYRATAAAEALEKAFAAGYTLTQILMLLHENSDVIWIGELAESLADDLLEADCQRSARR